MIFISGMDNDTPSAGPMFFLFFRAQGRKSFVKIIKLSTCSFLWFAVFLERPRSNHRGYLKRNAIKFVFFRPAKVRNGHYFSPDFTNSTTNAPAFSDPVTFASNGLMICAYR